MKKYYLLSFFILIASHGFLFAQANPVEIIAKFQPNVDISVWQKTNLQEENTAIVFKEVISNRTNLALFTYDESQISLEQVEKTLEKSVLWIAPNYSNVTARAQPNDSLYDTQWGLTDIDAEAFWEINTDGLTYNGDTIVLAVMETGTSVQHPDLLPNLWHNYQEIPDDGFDNDGNGYVDDFIGWNSWLLNDEHPYDAHGTKTTGVLGAKGNNELGVSGVNWNVKVMPISFIKANFATYFKAFDYLIDQRKLYNQTNGQKGAFIVAVNESFGQDNAMPGDSPNFMQWCEYMDSLGAVGILTIAATINNSDINVDVAGDMPTTCPQEHLIAVTNLDATGTRYGGYGPNHIDLAAPGVGITTTNGTDSYSSYGGTSSAAPHVAGTVGLIYSYPCENWSNYIKTNPSEAALRAKTWILENTIYKTAMADRSVSEGSLNLLGIIEDLEHFCGGNKLEPIDISITTITNGPVHYTYDLPQFGDFEISIFNMLGQRLHTQNLNSDDTTLQEGTIDTSFLPTGMYLLRITQGDEYALKKFVLSK